MLIHFQALLISLLFTANENRLNGLKFIQKITVYENYPDTTLHRNLESFQIQAISLY
jgi:hypothetical protein